MLKFRGLAVALPVVLLLSTAIAIAQSGKDTSDMEKRIAALEGRLAVLEQKVAANLDQGLKEEQAAGLYREAQSLAARGEYETAKTKMNELFKKYAGTNAQRQGVSFNAELQVIGKAAPSEYNIERWFQGEGQVDFKNGKTTLLVFWEQWCPHCRREVPKIDQIYARYREQGLQVVGLTKINRSSTVELVEQFVRDQKVSYPMAKETGDLSRYFNVSGIPAAAVVKDGKVIWRGHPARLNDSLLQKWLNS